jgi:hypothetical protein
MKGYENQGKDNTNLIYDDGFTKKFIPAKIPEEYTTLTQLLSEDKITIYEICENYPHIYETYYKVLEKITLERDSHKEREIPEVAWIYGLPCSGKTEFAQDTLKTNDLTKKDNFFYTGLLGHKNILYENVINGGRLEDFDEDVFK